MVNRSLRTKFLYSSTIGVLLGTVFYGLKEYFYEFYESVINIQIAGWYIPWKPVSVCIFVALLFAYYKIRKWTNAYTSPHRPSIENGPVVVSGKTLLEIHTANQNIRELSRRLDSVEKTTHLVMKQLEAVTKCMTEVLREGTVRSVNNNQNSNSTPETHL